MIALLKAGTHRRDRYFHSLAIIRFYGFYLKDICRKPIIFKLNLFNIEKGK